MSARALLDEIERDLAAGNFAPSELGEADILRRALRLLAAAESNDGTTPETDALAKLCSTQFQIAEIARSFERERNGLAARVMELEARVRLLNIFKGCAMDAIEAHEITNQGDTDAIGALIGIAARSKP